LDTENKGLSVRYESTSAKQQPLGIACSSRTLTARTCIRAPLRRVIAMVKPAVQTLSVHIALRTASCYLGLAMRSWGSRPLGSTLSGVSGQLQWNFYANSCTIDGFARSVHGLAIFFQWFMFLNLWLLKCLNPGRAPGQKSRTRERCHGHLRAAMSRARRGSRHRHFGQQKRRKLFY
jgi:hypothetical protein